MTTPEITPDSEPPFYFGDNYLLETFWYIEMFPLAWAQSHLPRTGPVECQSCREDGCLHGGTLFVGYCADCAVYAYGRTRGHGFVKGQEQVLQTATETSATATYLRNVNLEDIPPLLILHEDEEEEFVEDFASSSSILDCHFEGGYNDF